jgi:hypothetical protein
MRHTRYLNVILTVNAILLAALVWTQVAGSPLLAEQAAAQKDRAGGGMATAGAQRLRMVEALKDVQRSVEASKRLLESGKVRVQVTNLDEIRIDRRE